MKMLEEYSIFLSRSSLRVGSVSAYIADIRELYRYADGREVTVLYADERYLTDFLQNLRKSGASDATLRRMLSSLHRFYGYLVLNGILSHDPSKVLRAPPQQREKICPLSPQEVDKLLCAPDGNTPKALRDRALLELLYASAISVSELIALNVADYFPTGFLTLRDDHIRRQIELYPRARAQLDSYLLVRHAFFPPNGENALFLNTSGGRLSRQGVWKLLREYGEKAELGQTVTPRLLRASLVAHLANNGMSSERLQMLLGHKNRLSTEALLASLDSADDSEMLSLSSFHPRAKN